MEQFELFATAAFGLEAVVARELRALGYEPEIVGLGQVLFRGDESAICRANLWLRSADRVLIKLGQFSATDFGQLFDGVRELPWGRWLPADASFPVNGRSRKSQLSSVPACQKIVKKAVVESLRAAHSVSTLDETGPRFPINVALLDDEATLTIDTSGPSLHKRGYRTLVGPAPLKETLAAAMVQLSFWQPGRPLIDPFCGAGTIAIEAALIGRRIAPGLNREFLSEQWPQMRHELWRQARDEARDLVEPPLQPRILGSDSSEEAIKLARYHAEQAGVVDDIHFQQRDFSQISSKRQYGCVISNPPYGRRIGDEAEVRELYESIPLVLRRLPTWSHYFLSASSQLETLVGRQADRRRKLYNGRIQCTLYQFYGPKPGRRKAEQDEDDPAVTEAVVSDQEGPVQDEGDAPGPESDATQLAPRASEPHGASRGSSAEDRSLPSPPASTVPLQASGNAPEHPGGSPKPDAEQPVATKPTEKKTASTAKSRPKVAAAADRPVFGGLTAKAHEQAELFRRRLTKRARHLRRWPTRRQITCYRLYDRDIPEIPIVVDRYEDYMHIADCSRPYERTPAEHADWVDLMVRTAGQVLDIPAARTFVKRRQRQQGRFQYVRGQNLGPTLVANEGGLRFQVNLSDYIDTGLFLDHRNTRSLVRDLASGKRFLNLFGYTGAFTVYAASGGALATTTVDWSNTYLAWARKNMELNELRGPQHGFVRSDSIAFLRSLPRRPCFDLAVVDPPTFSNSKRTEVDWDVQRDHVALLNELLVRISPGGTVFFSTNSRRFKFDEANLRGAAAREITRNTVPEDFRNRRIHRCWRLVRNQDDRDS